MNCQASFRIGFSPEIGTLRLLKPVIDSIERLGKPSECEEIDEVERRIDDPIKSVHGCKVGNRTHFVDSNYMTGLIH